MEFKSWLRPDPNSTQRFNGLACNRPYALLNKGISAINGTHGHTKVPQHQENLNNLKASKETQINFFKPKSQADQSTAVNASIPANQPSIIRPTHST